MRASTKKLTLTGGSETTSPEIKLFGLDSLRNNLLLSHKPMGKGWQMQCFSNEAHYCQELGKETYLLVTDLRKHSIVAKMLGHFAR